MENRSMTQFSIIKDVQKKHATTAEMCKKYGCQPEVLAKRIGQIFKGSSSEGILQELSKNDKKSLKVSSRAKKKMEETGAVEDVTEENAAKEDTAVPMATKLAELRREEHEQSQVVMGLESHAVKIYNERRKLLQEMRQLEQDAFAINQALISLGKKIEELGEEDAKIVTEAGNVLADIHIQRDKLGAIREEIRKLERVQIMVYNDGSFDVLSAAEDFVLDHSGSEAYAEELMRDELCTELKVREVFMLAKVLKIAERAAGRTIEFTFESSEMEVVYQLMTATKTNVN